MRPSPSQTRRRCARRAAAAAASPRNHAIKNGTVLTPPNGRGGGTTLRDRGGIERAVVVTFTVADAGLVPSNVPEYGESEQLDDRRNPPQPSETGLSKP